MKIGMFTDTYLPSINGISISIDILQKELTKLGHHVDIITKESDVIHLDYDVVHIYTGSSLGKMAKNVAIKKGIPVVFTEYHFVHEMDKEDNFIATLLSKVTKKKYINDFLNSVDYIIYPTYKSFKQNSDPLFRQKSQVIPTGIYLEQYRKINFKDKEIKGLRNALGIHKKDFVMIYVGEITKEKHVDILIDEFSQLKTDITDIKLLLIGDGKDREFLMKKVDELNISEDVIFTGEIPHIELPKYIHTSDLFVSFDDSNYSRLSYLEALACGVPLLVLENDLHDILIPHFNGLSFMDSSDFKETFDLLTRNKVKFLEISSNASKSLEKFSAKNYAYRVLEVYKRVLD
jgi:1,2-diacylglycerol 3-alpha-glucosyltransferase